MMDTTKASGRPIPDGIYILQPDGSAWEVYEFRGSRHVGGTCAANADTHDAARDSWAGVRPSEWDDLLDTDDPQLAIDIALACGYEDAYGVSVCRYRGITAEEIEGHEIHFEPSEDGGYTATVPDLPGCVSEGDTLDEARRNIREAIVAHCDD